MPEFQLSVPSFSPDELSELRGLLRQRCARKIMASNNTVCCFVDKTMYIIDESFAPLLMFESASFICACGISDSGRYAVCQTANNYDVPEEAGVTILFDTQTGKSLAARRLETGFKGTRFIHIDEVQQAVFVYDGIEPDAAPVKVKFNFDLLPDEDSLEAYYDAPGHSPYTYNGRARELIEQMWWDYSPVADAKVRSLLSRIDNDPRMSTYQLSETYKALGDAYAEHDMPGDALQAYQHGVELNPKLPVKRTIKKLAAQVEG